MEHKIMDGIGAHQQGYDDAMYDGIDTFSEFGCNCEKCKADYEAGWNEGLEELERSLIQHSKNFVQATPPATSYVEDTSGAKFPKSYTFDGVNNFVFSTNVGFEDLQSLCLDLVSRLEKSNTDQVDGFMEFRKTQSVCHGLPVWVVNVLRSFVAWQAAQQSVHLTGGSLRGLQAFSTPQPDTGLKADSNPPASK